MTPDQRKAMEMAISAIKFLIDDAEPCSCTESGDRCPKIEGLEAIEMLNKELLK